MLNDGKPILISCGDAYFSALSSFNNHVSIFSFPLLVGDVPLLFLDFLNPHHLAGLTIACLREECCYICAY